MQLLTSFESSGDEGLLGRINAAFAHESYAQLENAFAVFVLENHGDVGALFDSLSDDHINAMETFSMNFLYCS